MGLASTLFSGMSAHTLRTFPSGSIITVVRRTLRPRRLWNLRATSFLESERSWKGRPALLLNFLWDWTLRLLYMWMGQT